MVKENVGVERENMIQQISLENIHNPKVRKELSNLNIDLTDDNTLQLLNIIEFLDNENINLERDNFDLRTRNKDLKKELGSEKHIEPDLN